MDKPKKKMDNTIISRKFYRNKKNSNDVDLEVDPGRVSNLQNLERNQITLRLLCEKIWLEIQQSHLLFPQ